MQNRTIGWILVVLFGIGIVYAVSQRTTNQPLNNGTPTALPEVIKIGVVLPLTGDAAVYGTPLQQSIQLAVAEVNAAGGVSGKLIELVAEDGKCSGPDAVNAIQKLIQVDRVPVVIGEACSGATLAMAPIANDAKVVLISPSATSPDITTKGGLYVFRTAPSDAFQGRIAAEYAYKSLNARKAAVVAESTEYAQGLSRVFKQRFGELGGAVAVDVTYNPGETSFASHATRVLAGNPDVVYLVPQVSASGINFLKQYRNQNGRVQVMGSETLAGRDIVKTNASIMEGLLVTEPAVNASNPATQAFLDAFTSAYQEPSFPAFQAGAYDTVFLLRDGIAAVGYNGEQLQRWLAGVTARPGALGTFGFDGDGDVTIATYSILKAEKGKFTPLAVQQVGE